MKIFDAANRKMHQSKMFARFSRGMFDVLQSNILEHANYSGISFQNIPNIMDDALAHFIHQQITKFYAHFGHHLTRNIPFYEKLISAVAQIN